MRKDMYGTDYLHVPPWTSVTNPAENKQQQTTC